MHHHFTYLSACKVRPLYSTSSRPILGRPKRLPGPLEKLPDIVQGTSTRQHVSKKQHYVPKKSIKPKKASINEVSLFGNIVGATTDTAGTGYLTNAPHQFHSVYYSCMHVAQQDQIMKTRMKIV